MDRFTDVVQDKTGRVVAGASILVRDATGSVATIYENRTGTLKLNPFLTDSLGKFTFCAADGLYSVDVTVNGSLYATLPDIRLDDPSEGISGTGDVGMIATDTFSGTGAQTVFNLSIAPPSEQTTQVYVDGVYQRKNSYSLDGSVLTFSEAPPLGADNIEVMTIMTGSAAASAITAVAPTGQSGADVQAVLASLSGNIASNKAELASGTGAAIIGATQAGVGAVVRTLQSKGHDFLHAKDYGVIGNGTVDDYPAFVLAVNAARTLGKPLVIDDLKIYLASQSASINLDGVLLIRGNGKLPKLDLSIAYLNGTDNAVAVWTAAITGVPGSAIFSRYNGPIFTGKTFPVKNFSIVGDYLKASSTAFTQSAVTAYPGWSQALKNTNVDVYYTGSDGIKLTGGLELCAVRNVNVWFCGGIALNIGTTGGMNCPIEYLDFDDTCSFIYGKLGNVWLNGFRRHVKLEGCLVNAAGQYDVQLVANPAFTVASQTAIVPPIRVTALAAGLYDGVNHTGSDQLEIARCFAEVAQGIVQIDGSVINAVDVRHCTLIPWNNALPKNILSIQGNVYRLRTHGNANIDATFPIYIGAGPAAAAVDFLIEEATAANVVSYVGSMPVDAALTPPPKWRQQSGTIGDGNAGTFTYSVAINQQTPNNTAAATAIWAISANFQDAQLDRNETVLIAVTRVSSGNYVGQVLIAPATTQVFSSAPSVTTDGVLQIPLTLYSRARVTRLDMQPLRLV